MFEHKQFNYLYLGKLRKLGKLTNPTKKNFGKPKMTVSEQISEQWVMYKRANQ